MKTYIISDVTSENSEYDLNIYFSDWNIEGCIKEKNDVYLRNLNEYPLDFGKFMKLRIQNFNQENWNEYVAVANKNLTHLEIFKSPNIHNLSRLGEF